MNNQSAPAAARSRAGLAAKVAGAATGPRRLPRGQIALFAESSQRMGVTISPPYSLTQFGRTHEAGGSPPALLPKEGVSHEAQHDVQVVLANDMNLRNAGATMMVETSSSRKEAKAPSADAAAPPRSAFWHAAKLWEPYSFPQVHKTKDASVQHQKSTSFSSTAVLLFLVVGLIITATVVLYSMQNSKDNDQDCYGGSGFPGGLSSGMEQPGRYYGQSPYLQVQASQSIHGRGTHHSLRSCQSVPTGPASTSSVISHMRDPRFASGQNGAAGSSAVMARREAYGGYGGGPQGGWPPYGQP